MGARVSALGHIPGREGWPRRRRARARGRRRSRGEALGFGDRPARRRVGGTLAVRSGIPRRPKRRLLGGGNAPGLGRDDARATMPLDPFAAPGASGSFEETRWDAPPRAARAASPRPVRRPLRGRPLRGRPLAPAPVRGGHSEARGSAGARAPTRNPRGIPPARAPPPVAAHYAHPDADLEASLASRPTQAPLGPRPPPAVSRRALRGVRRDRTSRPSRTRRRDRPREGRRQG